ncbi:MAG: hypothetical protein AAF628_00010 [Planctomycetota bacterium]
MTSKKSHALRVLAASAPFASSVVAIPTSPRFLGAPLRSQSLVFPADGSPPRLTHSTIDVVR